MKKYCTILFLIVLHFVAFAQTPRIVINAKGHTAKIQNLLFTPDAKQLISISEDKSIRIWNAETGKLIARLEGQIGDGWEGMLYASAISPDGKLLAVAGYPVKEEKENYILVIDLSTNEQVSIAVGHTNVINNLAFTRDGKNLLSASDDGTVKFWGVTNNRSLSNLATLTVGNPISCMSYNSRSQEVALVAGGRDILVYKLSDIAIGNPKIKPRIFKKHEGELHKLVYSPDGLYLASSSQTNELIIWNADGSIIDEIKKLERPINALAFSNDSKILTGLDTKGKGFSWAVQSGAKFTDFTGHNNAVFSAVFMPSSQGHYVVASAGGINNEIILWNAINGTIVLKIKGNGRAVCGLSFGEGLQLQIATELDKSGNPKYSSVFDFSSMTFKSKSDTITPIKTKKSVQQTGENDLSMKGKTIHTNPLTDGRILDFIQLSNESVVVSSDFSLKQFDKNGSLLKDFNGHSGAVRAVTVSSDGRYLCSGAEDQTIMIWRLTKEGYAPALREVFQGKEWQDYFTSLPVDSLTKLPTKKAWQQVIAFLRTNEQKSHRDIEDVYNKLGETVIPFVTLFITEDGEFVCWNPHGYFTCSSSGASYFGWHINKGIHELADFYKADQYFDVLYSPEEMSKSILEGKSVEDVLKAEGKRIFDLTKLRRPSAALFVSQPSDTSKINFEKGIAFTSATKIPLTINIQDGGGGVKELNIFQNEKLILIDKDFKMKGDRDVTTKTYVVDMANEVNDFKVKVINYQKIESRPDVFVVEYRGQAITTSSLHILSVGINKYANSFYDLNYAQPDAQSFTEKFVEKSKSIFKKINQAELYDENATKANIIAKLNAIIAQAKPEDVFLFYYAGHGLLNEDNDDEYYFVPTDVTKLYGDQDQLSKKGISASELKNYLAQIKARKQVILMDACHSGGAMKTLNVRTTGMDEKAIVQLARSSGVAMIASSGTKQFATEFAQLKHGVFTYALLEALDGKADNGDKKITVNELKLYMEERVPDLTKQYGGKAQYPTGYITGNDFPISIVEDR